MKKCRYICDNCSLEFIGPKTNPTCPQCDSEFFSTVVKLGLWYMLGDWMGFWGEEEAPAETFTDLDEAGDFDESFEETDLLDDFDNAFEDDEII